MPIKKKKPTENFQNSNLKRRADQGDAEAQYLLGGLYDIGQDVSKDYAQARQWWKKAASQGHAEAQYLMGGLHDIGHGVPQGYVKARQWYEKPLTRVMRGHSTISGCCMPKDWVSRWIQRRHGSCLRKLTPSATRNRAPHEEDSLV